ncbi:MAG: hypothetical protein JW715_01460 [Sedimentisphaerales bacterium]|nr:hypothetical protein [Sedimentisphaerales bacterium]
MRHIGKKFFSRLSGTPFFSPAGFFSYAVIITVTYFILEAIGLRSYTAVLFGMDSIAAADGWLAVCLAGLFLLFYFAFIFLAPVFFLGSILFLFILKFLKVGSLSKQF